MGEDVGSDPPGANGEPDGNGVVVVEVGVQGDSEVREVAVIRLSCFDDPANEADEGGGVLVLHGVSRLVAPIGIWAQREGAEGCFCGHPGYEPEARAIASAVRRRLKSPCPGSKAAALSTSLNTQSHNFSGVEHGQIH
jgi:hypothetical protein